MIISALSVTEDYDKKRNHLDNLASLCKNMSPELAHFYSFKSIESLNQNTLKKRKFNEIWKESIQKCMSCGNILKEKRNSGGKLKILGKKNHMKEIVIICNICHKQTSLYHIKRAQFLIPEQNTVIQNKSENKRGLLNSELMSQPQHRTLEVIHKKKVKKVKTENKQNTFEWKIDLPTKNELESIEIKARLKQDNQKIKEQIEIIDKVVSEFEEKIQNKDALTSEKIQEIITGQVENQENIENKVSVTQENKISNFDLETGNQESKKPKSQNQIEPETIDLTKTILSTPITEVKMADKPNSSENPTISLYDLFS